MNRARVLVALALAAGCSAQPQIANRDATGTAIICFGDSLTRGEGASEGHDYPSLLAQQLGQPVVNAGVNGDTTADGLARLERDVLALHPRLVIVAFGGNDFLRGVRWDDLFGHLDEMVRRIQERGAMVVLIGVQPGMFGDAARERYAQIAQARRAAFVPNMLEGILNDPQLKSDTIHPNDAGYQRIAERMYAVVQPLVTSTP